MRTVTRLAVALLLAGLLVGPATAQEGVTPHAGMLRYPDVSADQIVFVYANDLWLVSREGGVAQPLASPPGQELMPKFSQDGTVIAFQGNYDGDRDLYTIPVGGGIPYRVTHHPANELLTDWMPDGRLLFSAGGITGIPRAAQLFSVAANGGLPAKLPVPYGADSAVSPDGEWLAYTPYSRNFRTWKRYRGGLATDIWLFNLKDYSAKKITDWEGTDALPMWHGSKVYYLSDAGASHRLNIWVYDTGNGERRQVTDFSDFDVKWPSIGPGPDGEGEIVFQYGPELRLLDLSNGRTRAVEVTIPGARPNIRPRSVNAAGLIYSWDISSTGKRVAIEARGDIWTAPAENGTPRNLTRSSGSAERDPAWSPDGRWIAYLSDATGEYELYVTQSDGKGDTRQLTSNGDAFRYNPRWSPDSRHLVFRDKTGAIYLHTIESEETKLVDRDPWARDVWINWSHDSGWLAYDRSEEGSQSMSIWLYEVATGESHRATSSLFNDENPTFDRQGDYLYFKTNRSFSPIYEDLGTTWIYTGTEVLMAVPLRADIKSPYLPESDEETWKKDEEKKEGEEEEEEGEPAEGEDGEQAEDPVSGTWEGAASVQGMGTLNLTLVLQLHADNSVTGSVTIPDGTANITQGSYDPAAKRITATLQDPEGGTWTIAATIEGEQMAGSARSEEMGLSAEFTARRTSGPPRAGADEEEAPEAEGEEEEEEGEEEEEEKLEIDLEGFEQRALMLAVPNGRFGALAVNDKNQLIYARFPVPGSGDSPSIKLFDLKDKKKEEKTVVSGAGSFAISADGKKLLVLRGSSASIQDAASGASGKNVSTSGMTTVVNPREEWRQIFTDAWRLYRDFFYDPNMHGVDWSAVYRQYSAMLDDCASREDVSYVIGEMISELNVGHAYYGGGDGEDQPSVSVGLLGVDFELHDGAYRIARIYEGGPWDADARNPLNEPGMEVEEGHYLLAVNGLPLDISKDPWTAFAGMAGRTVTLTVSEKPEMDEDAREVVVDLLGSEGSLRYRDWIEHNRTYVAEKTGGRVGYIYVPDTGRNGQDDLVRQFQGQLDKEALIIDERWNGGGQIPTRFIELLNRPVTNYWARRDGNDWTWPPDSHQGPKCMLINGPSGSGGDMFPALFRQAGVGKLIGTRTWGGLVGLSGNPRLIDGGYSLVPTFAFYERDGTWGIEGHGVDPDIQVIDDPSLMVNGGDPQLDAAIEHILGELERNPYVKPARPSYPDRSGMGVKPEDV